MKIEKELENVVTTELAEELKDRFSYHQLDGIKRESVQVIRDECFKLGMVIMAHAPPGREQSIALTKLEEVMFFANAGISRE